MKILITGGHLTPALAVIHQLKADHQILFVGRATTDVYGSASHEQKQVEALGVAFTTINAPKLHRKPLQKNLGEISKTPGSLIRARQIISQFKPNVILSFGGYLALPIASIAKTRGIPIVTHEQTTTFGLTNQLLTRLATYSAVSWPSMESATHILTGNPVRPEFHNKQPKPNWLIDTQDKPLIYFTGGNQGSQAINSYIAQHLSTLAKNYHLVIQTGAARNLEDFQMLSKARDRLSPAKQKHVLLKPWLEASEVAWLMKNADLVVGRSGANTLTELIVTEAKSILIPLPVSGRGEQTKNAQLMQKLGLSKLLSQKDIQKLPELIKTQLNHKVELSTPARNMQKLHLEAAHKLSQLVLSCETAA